MEQCPVCYNELEVRDCAPCDDCGGNEKEIRHFQQGIHTYKIYEVYQGLRLTLCNFCTVDFGSYKSEYLGFSGNQRIDFENFVFVRDLVDPQLVKDKFCPECSARLKFLHFVSTVRELNKV